MLLLLLMQVLRIGFFKGMVDGNQFLLKMAISMIVSFLGCQFPKDWVFSPFSRMCYYLIYLFFVSV